MHNLFVSSLILLNTIAVNSLEPCTTGTSVNLVISDVEELCEFSTTTTEQLKSLTISVDGMTLSDKTKLNVESDVLISANVAIEGIVNMDMLNLQISAAGSLNGVGQGHPAGTGPGAGS